MSPKQTKFVTAKIRGKSNREAGLIAGAKTPAGADMYANRMLKNVKIQQAIQDALVLHELTPEFAIKELKSIVEQNKEIGAKRLAIKDVLELHGFKAGKDQSINLNVKQGFFKVSR